MTTTCPCGYCTKSPGSWRIHVQSCSQAGSVMDQRLQNSGITPKQWEVIEKVLDRKIRPRWKHLLK